MMLEEAIRKRLWLMSLAGPVATVPVVAVVCYEMAITATRGLSPPIFTEGAAVATWLAAFGVTSGIVARSNRIVLFGISLGVMAGAVAKCLGPYGELFSLLFPVFVFSAGLLWVGGCKDWFAAGCGAAFSAVMVFSVCAVILFLLFGSVIWLFTGGPPGMLMSHETFNIFMTIFVGAASYVGSLVYFLQIIEGKVEGRWGPWLHRHMRLPSLPPHRLRRLADDIDSDERKGEADDERHLPTGSDG